VVVGSVMTCTMMKVRDVPQQWGSSASRRRTVQKKHYHQPPYLHYKGEKDHWRLCRGVMCLRTPRSGRCQQVVQTRPSGVESHWRFHIDLVSIRTKQVSVFSQQLCVQPTRNTATDLHNQSLA
jgi:hypothetical protein